ncbi:MAG TPA: hypothetical protein VFR66_01975 [Burkholderiales bacterium]|nr:hypothetical protein [Burkholderiales bacterium]
MTHANFVSAYAAGHIRVRVERNAAARFVAGRTLLPLVLLPFLGLGLALALIGYIVTGTIVFLAALLVRVLVRRSSDGFIVWRALQDAEFYRQAMAAQALTIEECNTPSRSS